MFVLMNPLLSYVCYSLLCLSWWILCLLSRSYVCFILISILSYLIFVILSYVCPDEFIEYVWIRSFSSIKLKILSYLCYCRILTLSLLSTSLYLVAGPAGTHDNQAADKCLKDFINDLLQDMPPHNMLIISNDHGFRPWLDKLRARGDIVLLARTQKSEILRGDAHKEWNWNKKFIPFHRLL